MPAFSVTGLHHVQLAMPPGAEARARAFYRDVLGLREVPKPAELAGRGGAWFTGGGADVHLGTEDPFTPAAKAHPALVVDDLDAAHAALVPHGAGEISTLPGLRRFYVVDPFGNRIEICAPDG